MARVLGAGWDKVGTYDVMADLGGAIVGEACEASW